MKLDERRKELIAVGSALAPNCQPGLEHHPRKALEAGADQGEIAEAIAMGRVVRNGAACYWNPECSRRAKISRERAPQAARRGGRASGRCGEDLPPHGMPTARDAPVTCGLRARPAL